MWPMTLEADDDDDDDRQAVQRRGSNPAAPILPGWQVRGLIVRWMGADEQEGN